MPINALYKFIEKEYNEGSFEDSEIQIKLLERAIQQGEMPERYSMIDLKPFDFSFTHDAHYQLQDDHISVYEKIDQKNLHLSKYHYTAKFKNNKDVNYQLHVYFNEKDQPVLVEFAMENPDGGYTKLKIKSDLQSLFIGLAIDRIRITMGQLQEKHRHYIQSLVSEYEALEFKLHQMKPDGNEYESLLDSMMEKLRALSQYHVNQIYKKQEKLFQQILHHYASNLKNKDKKSESFVAKEKTVTESSGKEEVRVIHVKKNTSKKEDLSTYIPKLLSLKQKFDDAINNPEGTDEEIVKYFLDYERYCDMLELLAEEERFSVDNATLKEIKYHYALSHQQGLAIIKSTLSGYKYHLAEQLKEDLSDVAEDWLRLALGAGDAKLLEFVLTRSSIAINSFMVDGNNNPILYCYLMHSASQPMLECLSVLVNQGASIFVKLDDGFSVANHILRDPTHPLLPALEHQPLPPAEFLRVLIKEIDERISSVTDKAIERKLSVLRDNFKIHWINVKNVSNAEAKKYMGNNIYMPRLENKTTVDDVDAFLMRQDIKQLMDKYNGCYQTYLNGLSGPQRAKEIASDLDSLDKLISVFKNMNCNFSDALKDNFARLLRSYIIRIENKTEINQYKREMIGAPRERKSYLQKLISKLALKNEAFEDGERSVLADVLIEGEIFKNKSLNVMHLLEVKEEHKDTVTPKKKNSKRRKSALRANSLLAEKATQTNCDLKGSESNRPKSPVPH